MPPACMFCSMDCMRLAGMMPALIIAAGVSTPPAGMAARPGAACCMVPPAAPAGLATGPPLPPLPPPLPPGQFARRVLHLQGIQGGLCL